MSFKSSWRLENGKAVLVSEAETRQSEPGGCDGPSAYREGPIETMPDAGPAATPQAKPANGSIYHEDEDADAQGYTQNFESLPPPPRNGHSHPEPDLFNFSPVRVDNRPLIERLGLPVERLGRAPEARPGEDAATLAAESAHVLTGEMWAPCQSPPVGENLFGEKLGPVRQIPKLYMGPTEVTYFYGDGDPRPTGETLTGVEAGLKYDQNKPRHSLIPKGTIEALLEVLEHGARTYRPDGWKDVPNGRVRYLDALHRHLLALEGGWLDTDSGLPHLAHVLCNAAFLLWLGPEEK